MIPGYDWMNLTYLLHDGEKIKSIPCRKINVSGGIISAPGHTCNK